MQRTIPHPPAAALVIMGVSGCGKSTLGALIARRLNVPFIEGDMFHPVANVQKMRGGTPLNDEDRWPWLDRVGIAAAASVDEYRVAVVACSALKRAYRTRLMAAAGVPMLFVMLDADREELAQRVGRRHAHYMPASLLDSQLATLEPPADDENALTLDARSPVDQLADRAIVWANEMMHTS